MPLWLKCAIGFMAGHFTQRLVSYLLRRRRDRRDRAELRALFREYERRGER